ncbi:hypothetical protein LZZ85_21730 [Terrimonas sp. NA20]|uniref:VCBS repeat-containing protein n=1 Tax=Terrimonas ginsenosidimutans TaxID=2908004 RepID=A0ABS9KXB8_9BACT|nr:hypothetical protein [Terrimonas ginsenosidimutans]MCG2616933.1 hypothetical protein [Terrimonas ginsenosidimutans]
MKVFRLFLSSGFLLSAIAGFSQASSLADSTGLPGDDFSLQGALALFKRSSSVEDFEKLLNTESSNVNNLDLNNDGQTDYVKVIDKFDNGVHAFILQVPVAENENQDIAVIELEKTGNESAHLQIIGDEDIYGEEVIIEPDGDSEGTAMMMHATDSGFEHGPAALLDPTNAVVVNVWTWPVVRFVYAPSYIGWLSPWHWTRRPVWWRPWRPVSWVVWRPRRVAHAPHYVVVRQRRVMRARQVYRPIRSTSAIVHTRYSASVGRYRATRTTTTIEGKNGRKVKVTKTKVRRRR